MYKKLFFFRRVYQDKAETAPLFPASTSMSPSAPMTASGSATINRTLLHSQQFGAHNSHVRNGIAPPPTTTRGLANLNHSLLNSGDSPPPQYDVVVHDISLQRHGFFYYLLFITFYFNIVFVNFRSHPKRSNFSPEIQISESHFCFWLYSFRNNFMFYP